MARFALHRITGKINGSTSTYDFYFLAPPGSYKGIEGTTLSGVTEITKADDIGYQMPLVKVEALLQSAAAVRRKLRVKAASATKSTYKTIIVAQEKAAGFEAAVQGKTTDKGVVQGVVESLDATFY
jgi:hypothetical protein